MQTESSRFKYIDREKERTLALIPGWAIDYRIFDKLELEYNYIIPTYFMPWGFTEDLGEFLLKSKISKIDIFGFSLGGFLGVEFYAKYPGLVNKLILTGIRRRYNEREIKDAITYLKRNKKAYLHKFYSNSFGSLDEATDFKKYLGNDYINSFDLDYLLKGIEYLGGSQIDPQSLRDCKDVKILHGEEDKIAPVREAIEIRNNLNQAELITIKGGGHNLFFNREFNEVLHNV